MSVKAYKAKIGDVKPLKQNPNKGSERGQYMLESSFEQGGAGRSGLLSADNTILAGNHAHQAAGASGIEDIIIVETTGNELVFVKRVDIPDENDPRAQNMIILDNRASDFHDYDHVVIQAMKDRNPEIVERAFHPNEIQAMIGEQPGTGKTQQDKLDVFLKHTIHQLVFYFKVDEYKQVVDRLAEIMDEQGLESHTHVFLHLLEAYEHA